MYPTLTKLARKSIKESLAECSDDQQLMFKYLYAPPNGYFINMPIGDVVDKMDSDRLGWALEQVVATIAKNEKRELDFHRGADIVTP